MLSPVCPVALVGLGNSMPLEETRAKATLVGQSYPTLQRFEVTVSCQSASFGILGSTGKKTLYQIPLCLSFWTKSQTKAKIEGCKNGIKLLQSQPGYARDFQLLLLCASETAWRSCGKMCQIRNQSKTSIAQAWIETMSDALASRFGLWVAV